VIVNDPLRCRHAIVEGLHIDRHGIPVEHGEEQISHIGNIGFGSIILPGLRPEREIVKV
jgi:hypothetical protein